MFCILVTIQPSEVVRSQTSRNKQGISKGITAEYAEGMVLRIFLRVPLCTLWLKSFICVSRGYPISDSYSVTKREPAPFPRHLLGDINGDGTFDLGDLRPLSAPLGDSAPAPHRRYCERVDWDIDSTGTYRFFATLILSRPCEPQRLKGVV